MLTRDFQPLQKQKQDSRDSLGANLSRSSRIEFLMRQLGRLHNRLRLDAVRASSAGRTVWPWGVLLGHGMLLTSG